MRPTQGRVLFDLSSSHYSSRTFTGCLSIGEPCTRLLNDVIRHYLALALNTCVTLLMFTSLLDPCTLPQILVYWALPMSNYSPMISILLQPRFQCMEFFDTCVQTSTGIWLLQSSFENSSVFSQLMNYTLVWYPAISICPLLILHWTVILQLTLM